jgi:hypothetical protein
LYFLFFSFLLFHAFANTLYCTVLDCTVLYFLLDDCSCSCSFFFTSHFSCFVADVVADDMIVRY